MNELEDRVYRRCHKGTDSIMKIIVVSARTHDQVYKEAAVRRNKHKL